MLKGLLAKLFPDQKKQIPIDIEEDWQSYIYQANQIPFSVLINLGLKEVAPVADLPTLAEVIFILQDASENGLPQGTDTNYDTAEDALTKPLEAAGFIQVARRRGGGVSCVFLYGPGGLSAQKIVEQTLAKHANYQIRVNQILDPGWHTYLSNLFPSAFHQQVIRNNGVISNLAELDDDISAERDVTHVLLFHTKADRDVIANAAPLLGYTVADRPEDPNEDDFYLLELSNCIALDDDRIDDQSWELNELAKENNAEYDGWYTSVVKKN